MGCITLLIDRQVQQEMEANLIDNDTVKECIWCARAQGSGFVDQNGVNLACLKRSVMTYWVEYTETPEAIGFKAHIAIGCASRRCRHE